MLDYLAQNRVVQWSMQSIKRNKETRPRQRCPMDWTIHGIGRKPNSAKAPDRNRKETGCRHDFVHLPKETVNDPCRSEPSGLVQDGVSGAPLGKHLGRRTYAPR